MNTTAQIIGGLGATELLIIGAIIVMMFGASKLPELARGGGQALRIFKSETKGLMDDDSTDKKAKHVSTDEADQVIVTDGPIVTDAVRADVPAPASSRSTID